jgi:hypothetical protein
MSLSQQPHVFGSEYEVTQTASLASADYYAKPGIITATG